jgi:hypothetical protein
MKESFARIPSILKESAENLALKNKEIGHQGTNQS